MKARNDACKETRKVESKEGRKQGNIAKLKKQERKKASTTARKSDKKSVIEDVVK